MDLVRNVILLKISEPLRTSETCTVQAVEPVVDIRTSSQVELGGWDTPGPAMTTPPPTLPDSLEINYHYYY